MPIIKKSTTPPPAPKTKKSRNSGAVGAAGGFKSQQKKDPAARRRPIESLIYGEEILRPLIKREKEIVVSFYPFTQNELRISTEGKFIIERFTYYIVDSVEEGLLPMEELVKRSSESHWNLYYFIEPIIDFVAPSDMDKFKEVTYNIDLSKCEVFKDFSNSKDLEDKVVAIVREEYFQARQIKLEELKEEDKLKMKEEELEREKLESKEENNEEETSSS